MGSRGDVEPFLALAAGLRRPDHNVTVATHAEFAALVAEAGVDFVELGGNPREAVSSPEGQRMLRTGNPLVLCRGSRLWSVGSWTRRYLPDAPHARAPTVVFSTLAQVELIIADQLGIPAVAAHLQPATPTTSMPAANLPSLRPPPAALNKATGCWLRP